MNLLVHILSQMLVETSREKVEYEHHINTVHAKY